ncbi:hypothetical protein BQ6471_02706 [Vibrio gazogenes]|nr:hypothetical protein BQ6471_02706 [Vibrio gazogenes]
MQVFLAQMTQIQMDDIAEWMWDGVAFLLFVPESLRNFVTRTEFHIFVFRLADRCFRAHTVILQVTVAVFIDDNTAFTPTPFGHQDPCTGQTCRMVLDKLHIAKWHTVTIGHSHTITGYNATIGITLINTACTTSRQNDGFCFNRDQFTFCHMNGNQTLHLTVVHQQINHEVFVKAFDLWIFHGCLK